MVRGRTGLLIFLIGVLPACQLRLTRDITVPDSNSTSGSSAPAPTQAATVSTASTTSDLAINPTSKVMITHDSFTFASSGGVPPLSFQVVSGLGAIDALTGIFTAPGTSGDASIKVLDSLGYSSTSSLTVLAPTQIASGGNHTCALLNNGSVQCWGFNFYGQLGNGSTQTQNTPVYVFGISNAEQIALGDSHTCALLGNGTVKCWGYGANGQLGDGLATSSIAPVAVSGLSGVNSISLGTSHSCARIGGVVKCWGKGSNGQLGDGSATQQNTPIAVSGITAAIDLDAGGDHTCAVLTGGSIQCWGLNTSGRLGDGTTIQRNTSVAVSGISTATSVAAGTDYTCARLNDSTVKCWGNAFNNQLGDGSAYGTPVPNRATPVAASGVTTATQIAAGKGLSCAPLSDGSVKCWGRQLDDYSGYGGNNSPTVISGITGASSIVAGNNHLCVLQSDSRVKCWGRTDTSQLGIGTVYAISSVPLSVIGISNPTDLIKGQNGSKTCALFSGGTLKCWGYNNTYFGDGTTAHGLTPVLVSGLSGLTAVSIGNKFSCAVFSDGTMKCWGYNQSGQLGNGGVGFSQTYPVSVSGITNALAVATGAWNTCAILNDGAVPGTGSMKCWGDKWYGQIGNGTSGAASQTTPVPVTGVTDAKALAVGQNHACAILNDGTVKCWGGLGEVGDGTFFTRTTPVSTGVTNGVSISSYYSNTCAVLADGSVKCWGGDFGLSPVSVAGISSAVEVTTGYRNSAFWGCARISDGTVKCWGENSVGQLGDGTTVNRTSPVTVVGISNAVKLRADDSSACVLLATGQIKCWGDNAYGQLGDGTAGVYMSPLGVGPWQ